MAISGPGLSGTESRNPGLAEGPRLAEDLASFASTVAVASVRALPTGRGLRRQASGRLLETTELLASMASFEAD